MKQAKLLNSELSYEVAKMGHFDTLTIGDAGLPVPEGVKRIDLAITLGVPSFREVFYATMSELKAQKMTLASEIVTRNVALHEELVQYCATHEITLELIPHEEFKICTASSKAVVRTGECLPYANVIIESNVIF